MARREPRARHRFAGSLLLLGLIVGVLVLPNVGATTSNPAAPPPPPALYTEYVAAPTLASTESFSFEFDGATHSAPGGSTVTLAGLAVGLHTIGNITATPAPPGWGYFGRATPNSPILVPSDPSHVSLAFSLVNLTAPLVAVAFHQTHIPFGTNWQVEFNGTVLTSQTLWINTTSRSGFVPVYPLSTLDPRGTTRYTAPPGNPAMPVSENLSGVDVVPLDYTVTFQVQVFASTGGYVVPNGTSWYAPGGQLTFRGTGYLGYQFGAWNGTGAGNYSGPEPRRTLTVSGPLVEAASFWPIGANRLVLRIDEVGLPAGVVWTVFVDGTGYSSPASAVVVPNVFACGNGSTGVYNVSIPDAVTNATDPFLAERFVPGSYAPTMCGGTVLNVTFSGEASVTYRASPGGAVNAINGSGPLDSGTWVPLGDNVSFTAVPASEDSFVGWFTNGSSDLTAFTPTIAFAVAGGVEEVAEFASLIATATPTYTLSLADSAPFPAGMSWTVVVNGSSYAASQANLTIPGLAAGTYAISIPTAVSSDGRTQLRPVEPATSVTVPASAVVSVRLDAWYQIDVIAGPGGSASSNESWAPAGFPVSITASASNGDTFVGWAGNGSGSYTGSNASWFVLPTGPIAETAAFAPVSVPPHNFTLLIVAAGVGVLLGIASAILFVRLRRAPAAPPGPAPPAAQSPATPSEVVRAGK